MKEITIYENQKISDSLTAMVPTYATTSLVRFSTGQAAFNWARKVNANNVTVIVKSNRRGHNDEPMTIVKESDGDHLNGVSSPQWNRISL